MKRKLLIILVSAFLFSQCSDSEEKVEIEQTLNDQIIERLESKGFVAAITAEEKIAISGTSLNQIAEELSNILNELGRPRLKVKTLETARASEIECFQSDLYESGGKTCANYVCLGSEDELVADICSSVCAVFWTTCV